MDRGTENLEAGFERLSQLFTLRIYMVESRQFQRIWKRFTDRSPGPARELDIYIAKICTWLELEKIIELVGMLHFYIYLNILEILLPFYR